jgi:Lysyl oxidase/Bacterial Ig domain
MTSSQLVTRQMRRVFIAALAAVLVVPATASATHSFKPDLVSDPAERPNFVVDSTSGGPERLLLRFNGYVHNIGHGPLNIQGSNPTDPNGPGVDPLPQMTTIEQVFRNQETNAEISRQAVPLGKMWYEATDGHNHFHFMEAAEYSLWDQAATGEVAPSQKVGFCMMDSQFRQPPPGSPDTIRRYDETSTAHCQMANPGATNVDMGISYGYRDTYMYWLALQWVDVSEVQPGLYQLRSHVDPDDRLDEEDGKEVNAPGDKQVRIKGYVAKPQAVSRKAGEAKVITLGADSYAAMPVDQEEGDPIDEQEPLGAAVYEIVDGPDHGTLSAPSGNSVTYTPNPGAPANDTFTFRVRENGNAFPRSPAVATVSVGRNPVAVGGAPGRVTVGKTVQLTSTAADVEWSVNGAVGGNTAVGTIDANGLYTAPATPPGAPVTVRAESANEPDAFAEVQMTIVEEPKVVPAPLPAPPETPPSDPQPPTTQIVVPPPIGPTLPGPALGTARASWIGPQAVVSVKAGRTGQLQVVVRRTRRSGRRTLKKTLGTCKIKVIAGRTYACRVKAKARKGWKVEASITLKPSKGKSTTKKLTFKSPQAKKAKASGHDHAAHGH